MKGNIFLRESECPIEAGNQYPVVDRDIARGHDWQPLGVKSHFLRLTSRFSTRRSVKGEARGGIRGVRGEELG